MITGRPKTEEEFKSIQADGKAIFHPTHHLGSPEVPNDSYPYWLNTGRLIWHWHTRTKTARVPYLNEKASEAYVEVHEEDASRLQVSNGDIVRVTSPRGRIEVPIRTGKEVNRGEVFVPFHFENLDSNEAVNALTMDVIDPLSHQPVLKQSICQVEKV